MTKVMVFGTFDPLHPGHVHFFQQAKQHGDDLVVVVARDSTVEKTKGKKPEANENDRLAMVRAQPAVDRAVLGYTGDVYQIIKEEKPDVICLGYDQTHFTDKLAPKLKEFKLSTKIIRLEPYQQETYKSSKIKKERAPKA